MVKELLKKKADDINCVNRLPSTFEDIKNIHKWLKLSFLFASNAYIFVDHNIQ